MVKSPVGVLTGLKGKSWVNLHISMHFVCLTNSTKPQIEYVKRDSCCVAHDVIKALNLLTAREQAEGGLRWAASEAVLCPRGASAVIRSVQRKIHYVVVFLYLEFSPPLVV